MAIGVHNRSHYILVEISVFSGIVVFSSIFWRIFQVNLFLKDKFHVLLVPLLLWKRSNTKWYVFINYNTKNWIWFKKIIQKTVNNSIITVKLCEKKKGVTLNIKCSQISLSMSISIVNNPYWIKIITVIPKTQYYLCTNIFKSHTTKWVTLYIRKKNHP